MEFYTITDRISEYTTDFKQMIEEATLLKTKLKLFQIAYFDVDLQTLKHHNLTLSSLNLSDFKLTKTCNLFVPLKNAIIKGDNDIKFRSYLIYLSYLYNIDLITLLDTSLASFYEVIFSLDLPQDLRLSLIKLMNNNDSVYFSNYIPYLLTNEAQEKIFNMSRTLRLQKIN